MFDLHGLMVSAGSACSSGAAKASLVLSSLGLKAEAKNGLRLSFSFNLQEEELELIMQRLTLIFTKLRASKA
jgi:cysteine desulfurase